MHNFRMSHAEEKCHFLVIRNEVSRSLALGTGDDVGLALEARNVLLLQSRHPDWNLRTKAVD